MGTISKKDKDTSTALTNVGEMALYDDILADAGTGMEEVDNDSFSIPYLIILQALSPIVQDNADNPDIRQGMIYNTSSSEAFKELEFIPCHFQRRFVCWDTSGTTGGFMGVFTPAELDALEKAGQLEKGDNGRWQWTDSQGRTGQMVDTRMHYVLYHNPNTGAWEPAVMSLSKTQVKHSKRLMTMIRTIQFKIKDKLINPPSWANIYKATVAKEKNDLGQWWGWSFGRVGAVTDADLYQSGKAFHDSVVEERAKAADIGTMMGGDGIGIGGVSNPSSSDEF